MMLYQQSERFSPNAQNWSKTLKTKEKAIKHPSKKSLKSKDFDRQEFFNIRKCFYCDILLFINKI